MFVGVWEWGQLQLRRARGIGHSVIKHVEVDHTALHRNADKGERHRRSGRQGGLHASFLAWSATVVRDRSDFFDQLHVQASGLQ